MIVTLVAGNGC